MECLRAVRPHSTLQFRGLDSGPGAACGAGRARAALCHTIAGASKAGPPNGAGKKWQGVMAGFRLKRGQRAATHTIFRIAGWPAGLCCDSAAGAPGGARLYLRLSPPPTRRTVSLAPSIIFATRMKEHRRLVYPRWHGAINGKAAHGPAGDGPTCTRTARQRQARYTAGTV